MHTPISPATKALFFFLSENSEGLKNAALVLGGNLALKRVQDLFDQLTTARELNRRARLDLVALHKLFTQEYVGNPDKLEITSFVEIDPAAPLVEDICLLADQLEDHMRAIDAAAVLPVFQLDMAA